jgi:hypothetical protein
VKFRFPSHSTHLQQKSGKQGADVIPCATLGATRSRFDEVWTFPLALFVSTRVALVASSYMGNVLNLGFD